MDFEPCCAQVLAISVIFLRVAERLLWLLLVSSMVFAPQSESSFWFQHFLPEIPQTLRLYPTRARTHCNNGWNSTDDDNPRCSGTFLCN
jgi:hypothetical protein